jgi:hypothetical protein
MESLLQLKGNELLIFLPWCFCCFRFIEKNPPLILSNFFSILVIVAQYNTRLVCKLLPYSLGFGVFNNTGKNPLFLYMPTTHCIGFVNCSHWYVVTWFVGGQKYLIYQLPCTASEHKRWHSDSHVEIANVSQSGTGGKWFLLAAMFLRNLLLLICFTIGTANTLHIWNFPTQSQRLCIINLSITRLVFKPSFFWITLYELQFNMIKLYNISTS